MTRPFAKHVILGAGALGSWLGARLDPPAFLVARGEHLIAMVRDGLRIGGNEDEIIAVQADDLCPDLQADSLVVVAVKTFDLGAAAAALRPKLLPDTAVAVLANGLAPEQELAAALDHPVVRIVAEFGVTLDAPGMVSAWGGRAVLGPGVDEDRVAAALAPTGLLVDRTDDLRLLAWEKLVLNCVANPLAALTGRRNRDLVSDDLKVIRRSVVVEAVAAAAAEGVDLPTDLADRIDRILSRSDNLNSMAQDVLRGRPTEIAHLNGHVADLAEARGSTAPVNRWLAESVRAKVSA